MAFLQECTFFIDSKVENFAKAFAKSLQETQQLISEEVSRVVGDDPNEVERLRQVYKALINKAGKANKIKAEFFACLEKEQNKLISNGISTKEIQLSRLMYVSGYAAYYFSEGKLDEAFNYLALSNKYLGLYENYIAWCNRWDIPYTKQKQENFKRDTLLKLIFGMANHGYDCNHSNIEKCASRISNKINRHDLQIDSHLIEKFIREAYRREIIWREERINKGEVEKIDKDIMLSIILGMAIDKYGFDPKSEFNEATGEKYSISIRIKSHIDVNNNTVRNCLNAAKKVAL